MVSMLAFNSDKQSSNPAEVFSVEFVFEKNENNQIRGRGWPTIFNLVQSAADNLP